MRGWCQLVELFWFEKSHVMIAHLARMMCSCRLSWSMKLWVVVSRQCWFHRLSNEMVSFNVYLVGLWGSLIDGIGWTMSHGLFVYGSFRLEEGLSTYRSHGSESNEFVSVLVFEREDGVEHQSDYEHHIGPYSWEEWLPLFWIYIYVHSVVRMSDRICLNEKETNHSLEYHGTQCKCLHVCHKMDTQWKD